MKWENFLGPEDQMQRAVGNYLDSLSGVLWTHPLNEGKRSKFERWKMKILGCKKGVPDVLIFHPKIVTRQGDMKVAESPLTVSITSTQWQFAGLAIELKAGRNRPTVEQSFWINSLQEKGWEACVCKSFDEAKAVIDNYLNI